jgi:16S rRNA (guanine966-N2)-methyltransferase
VAATLQANLASLGLEARGRVERGDVVAALRRLSRQGARFDLVFLDPPYASDEIPRALAALLETGLLADPALLVVEHARRHPVAPPAGLAVLDSRRYGDTQITRLVRDAPARPEETAGS